MYKYNPPRYNPKAFNYKPKPDIPKIPTEPSPPPITEKQTTENRSSNNELFEILGMKIYFDDLLLICILLFLYQEGIKDEYLFITIILLLLS